MRTKAMQRELALSAAALFFTACVGTDLEVPANHPGSPEANTGKIASSTALGKEFDLQVEDRESPDSAHAGHEHQSGGTPAASPSSETGERAAPSPSQQTTDGTTYVCPMHPEIVRKEPGKCPICGMKLVPKKEAK
jgi:hypothetical protein